MAQRNISFDELTSLLGDGQEPLPGVDGWRGRGCSSFRKACVDTLCAIDDLAVCRLDVEEAFLMWTGRPAVEAAAVLPGLADARWTFSWGGADLALKVLHRSPSLPFPSPFRFLPFLFLSVSPCSF